jgi:hypothetical protein
MADFKKGRKSHSQKRLSESRRRLKDQRLARRRDNVTHSTGFVFLESRSPFQESFQIGLFRFQPVLPILQTQNVADSFRNKSDYGKYAPFIFNLRAELTTCEEDWGEVMIDGERFSDLEPEDRADLIAKFSSDIILLLRLRGLTNFTTPFNIIGSTLRELKGKSGTVELRVRFSQSLIEFMSSPNPNPRLPEKNDFRWIEEQIKTMNGLNRDGRMNFIHDIYDALNYPNVSIQLMSIWSGIESVVLSETPGTRNSIQSRCAMILEDEPEKRKLRFKRIGDLYNFRCEVIHGKAKDFNLHSHIEDLDLSTGTPETLGENTKRLFESYELLTQLLLKVLERGEFWTREELREFQNDFPV